MKNNTLLTRVISIILITALLGSNIVWARPRAAGNVREDCLSAESQFHKLNFAEKLRKVRNILRSSEKTDMLKRFIQFDGSFLPEDAGATKKSARPEAKSIPLVKQLVPWYRELAFVRGAVDIDESRQYQDKLLVWNNESSLPEELNIIREDELTPAQAEECAQLIDKLGGEKYFVFSGGVRPVGYLLVEKSIFGEVTITVRDRSEGRYSGVECEILAFAYNKYFIDEDCRRIFINDPSEGLRWILGVKYMREKKHSVFSGSAERFIAKQKGVSVSYFDEKIALAAKEVGNARTIRISTPLGEGLLQLVRESIEYFRGVSRGTASAYYLERLLKRSANSGRRQLVIKIARSRASRGKQSFRTNSARYFPWESREAVIVFSDAFVSLLLKYEDRFPAAVKWIFVERLMHELCHDNQRKEPLAERNEEEDIILRNDKLLYENFIRGKELGDEIDRFWRSLTREEKAVMGSGPFFAMLEKLVEVEEQKMAEGQDPTMVESHLRSKIVTPYLQMRNYDSFGDAKSFAGGVVGESRKVTFREKEVSGLKRWRSLKRIYGDYVETPLTWIALVSAVLIAAGFAPAESGNLVASAGMGAVPFMFGLAKKKSKKKERHKQKKSEKKKKKNKARKKIKRRNSEQPADYEPKLFTKIWSCRNRLSAEVKRDIMARLLEVQAELWEMLNSQAVQENLIRENVFTKEEVMLLVEFFAGRVSLESKMSPKDFWGGLYYLLSVKGRGNDLRTPGVAEGISLLKNEMAGGRTLLEKVVFTSDRTEGNVWGGEVLVSVGAKMITEMPWHYDLREYNDLPLIVIRDAVLDMLFRDNGMILGQHLEKFLERKVDVGSAVEWIWLHRDGDGAESAVFKVQVRLTSGEEVCFGIISAKNSLLGSQLVDNDARNLMLVRNLYERFNREEGTNLPPEVSEVYHRGYGQCVYQDRMNLISMFTVEWLADEYAIYSDLDKGVRVIYKCTFPQLRALDVAVSEKIRQRTIMTAVTIFELTGIDEPGGEKIARMYDFKGDIVADVDKQGEVKTMYLITLPYFMNDPDSEAGRLGGDRKGIRYLQELIRRYGLENAAREERYLLLLLHLLNMETDAEVINGDGVTEYFLYKIYPEPETVFAGVTEALIRMYGREEGIQRAQDIFKRFAEKETEYQEAAKSYLVGLEGNREKDEGKKIPGYIVAMLAPAGFLAAMCGLPKPAFAAWTHGGFEFWSNLWTATNMLLTLIFMPVLIVLCELLPEKYRIFEVDEDSSWDRKALPALMFAVVVVTGVLLFSGKMGLEFPVIIGISLYYIAKVFLDAGEKGIAKKKSVFYRPAIISSGLSLIAYFNSNAFSWFLRPLEDSLLVLIPWYLNDFLAVPLFVLFTPILLRTIRNIANWETIPANNFSDFISGKVPADSTETANLFLDPQKALYQTAFFWAAALSVVCEFFGIMSTSDVWDVVMYFAGAFIFVSVLTAVSDGPDREDYLEDKIVDLEGKYIGKSTICVPTEEFEEVYAELARQGVETVVTVDCHSPECDNSVNIRQIGQTQVYTFDHHFLDEELREQTATSLVVNHLSNLSPREREELLPRLQTAVFVQNHLDQDNIIAQWIIRNWDTLNEKELDYLLALVAYSDHFVMPLRYAQDELKCRELKLFNRILWAIINKENGLVMPFDDLLANFADLFYLAFTEDITEMPVISSGDYSINVAELADDTEKIKRQKIEIDAQGIAMMVVNEEMDNHDFSGYLTEKYDDRVKVAINAYVVPDGYNVRIRLLDLANGLDLAKAWRALNREEGRDIWRGRSGALSCYGHGPSRLTPEVIREVVRDTLFAPVSARGLGKLRSPVAVGNPYRVQKLLLHELLEMIEDQNIDRQAVVEAIGQAFVKIEKEDSTDLLLQDIIRNHVYEQLLNNLNSVVVAENYSNLLLEKMREVRGKGLASLEKFAQILGAAEVQADLSTAVRVPVKRLKLKNTQRFDLAGQPAAEFREMVMAEVGGQVNVHNNFIHNLGVIASRNNIRIRVQFPGMTKPVTTSILHTLFYALALHEAWGHLQPDLSLDPDEQNALMSSGRKYRTLNLAVLFWYFNFFSSRRTDYNESEIVEKMEEFFDPEFNPELKWLEQKTKRRIIAIVWAVQKAWQTDKKVIGFRINEIHPGGEKPKSVRRESVLEDIAGLGLPEMEVGRILELVKQFSKSGPEQDLYLAEKLLAWARYGGKRTLSYRQTEAYYEFQLSLRRALEYLKKGKIKDANELYQQMQKIDPRGSIGIATEFSGELNCLLRQIFYFYDFAQSDRKQQLRIMKELLAEEEERKKKVMDLGANEMRLANYEREAAGKDVFPYLFYPLDKLEGCRGILQLLGREFPVELHGRIRALRDFIKKRDDGLYRETEKCLQAGDIAGAKRYVSRIRNCNIRAQVLGRLHLEMVKLVEGETKSRLIHLPLYLWRGFRQKLTAALAAGEISPAVYELVVIEGQGIGRLEDDLIIIEEEIIPLLVDFLNDVLPKTKRERLTPEDVIEYISYHEETHSLIQRNFLSKIGEMFTLEDELGMFPEYNQALEEMKEWFINNYGEQYKEERICLEEMVVTYITERDLLGRENILLRDKTRPRKALMPVSSIFRPHFEYLRLMVNQCRLAEYIETVQARNEDIDRDYVGKLAGILKGIINNRSKRRKILDYGFLTEEEIEVISLDTISAQLLLLEDSPTAGMEVDALSRKFRLFEERMLTAGKKKDLTNLTLWLKRYAFLIFMLQKHFREDEALTHINAFEKICLEYQNRLRFDPAELRKLPQWYAKVVYFLKGRSLVPLGAELEWEMKGTGMPLLVEGQHCLENWIKYVDCLGLQEETTVDAANFFIGWTYFIIHEYEKAGERFAGTRMERYAPLSNIFKLASSVCVNLEKGDFALVHADLAACIAIMKINKENMEMGLDSLAEALCYLQEDRQELLCKQLFPLLDEKTIIKFLYYLLSYGLGVKEMLLLYVNLAGKMEVVSILSLLDKICHFDSIHRAEKKPETFSLASVNARFDPVYLKQEAMAEIEEYARRSLKEMRKDSLIMIKEEDFSSDLLRKLLGEKKQQLKSELEGACRERGLTAGAIEKLWQGYEAKPDYEKLLADVDRIKSMVHSGVAGIRSAYGRMLVFSEEEEVELLNDFFLDQGAPGREEWVNKKIEEVVRGKISALLKKLSVLGVEISYEWDNAKDVEENRSLLAGELASVSETITEETGEYLDLAESNLADLNIKDAEEMILWAEENILKLRGTAVLLAQGITAIEERQDRLEDLCGRTREVLKEFARTEKNPVLIQRERRYEALLSAVKVANYPEALAGKITEAQRKVVEEIAIMRAFISEEYSRLLEEYGLSADEIDSWQVDVFLGDLNEEGLKRYLKSFALSKCRRRLRYLEGKVRVLEKSELSEETIMAVGREIAEVRSMIPAQIRPDLSAEYSSLEEEFSNLRLLFGRFKILQRRFPEFGAKRLTNILRRHKDKNADFVTALILSDSSLRKSGVVKVDPLNRAVYTDNLLLLDLAQMDAGNVRSVFITIKIEHIKIRDFSDLVVINADKKTEGEKSAILKMMLYNLLRLRDQRELSISIDGRPWNVWAGLCYYRSADRELVEDCQAYIKANVRNEYLSEVVLLGLGNAVYCVSAGYVDVWIIEDMDKVIHVRLIRDEDSFTLESVNPGKDFADFFSFVEKDTVALPVARAVTRGENLSDIDMCV